MAGLPAAKTAKGLHAPQSPADARLYHLVLAPAVCGDDGFGNAGNNLITVPVVALISLFPTVMHAVVFAYFYSVSSSLAVATVYHSAFDEVRDTLLAQVGFGPLVEVWQMALLTGIGMIILWKKKWPAASAS